ncbi:hypothetical protein BU14_0025s0060 [Porphyra umbilicalis]|uniref:NnrU domain-containing protein n=1 Tax=Porphyra umbilicalis TaxID=2786 RepID=A0A1X6PJY1_PORUM|nr:hypothetical protein BU14_0025s0060 [Porphyra umbilicalis]|eukprot:OSX81179.1 hypothetical protein BU14_0025s0060 [Porphyra umbilicalis]
MLAALAAFAALHSGLAGARARVTPVTGERAYRVVFALSSIAGAVATIGYFIAHRYDGAVLWRLQGVPGVHEAVWVASALSFLLLYPATFNLAEVAAVAKPGFRIYEAGVMRITRHPQLWGQVLWCVAHGAWLGSSMVVVASAGLIAHHLFGAWHGDVRLRERYGAEWDAYARRTSLLPFVALADGRQAVGGGSGPASGPGGRTWGWPRLCGRRTRRTRRCCGWSGGGTGEWEGGRGVARLGRVWGSGTAVGCPCAPRAFVAWRRVGGGWCLGVVRWWPRRARVQSGVDAASARAGAQALSHTLSSGSSARRLPVRLARVVLVAGHWRGGAVGSGAAPATDLHAGAGRVADLCGFHLLPPGGGPAGAPPCGRCASRLGRAIGVRARRDKTRAVATNTQTMYDTLLPLAPCHPPG